MILQPCIFSLSSILKLIFRSSPPEVFLGESVLKMCSKFAGEHSCRRMIEIFFFLFFIGSYIYIGKYVQTNETTAKFIKSDKKATKIWETMLPFCQQLPQEAGIELWNHKNSLRSRNIKNWFSLKVSYIHIAFLPSSIVKQMKFKFSKIRLLFFFFLLITTTSPLIDFPNCTDRLRRILKNWVNDTAKSK